MSSWFGDLKSSYPYSERSFYVLFYSMAHSVPFWFFVALYSVLERLPSMQGRRINKPHSPPELIRKAFVYVFCFHLVTPVLSYLTFDLHLAHVPWLLDAELPSLLIVAIQVAVCYLVADFLFYWMHRFLHLPFIYPYIHKQHHEFKITTAVAAEYAHPFELFFGNVVPMIAGPVLLRAHFTVCCLWLAIAMWGTTSGHSGFSGNAFHDYHHSHNVGNYGFGIPIWDALCGTDRHFKQFLLKKSAAKGGAPAPKS